MGMVTVRDGRHFGAGVLRADGAVLIGMAATNALARTIGAKRVGAFDRRDPDRGGGAGVDGPLILLDMADDWRTASWRSGADGGGRSRARRAESTSALAVREGGALRALGSWAETSAHKGLGWGRWWTSSAGCCRGRGRERVRMRQTLGWRQWFGLAGGSVSRSGGVRGGWGAPVRGCGGRACGPGRRRRKSRTTRRWRRGRSGSGRAWLEGGRWGTGAGGGWAFPAPV